MPMGSLLGDPPTGSIAAPEAAADTHAHGKVDVAVAQPQVP